MSLSTTVTCCLLPLQLSTSEYTSSLGRLASRWAAARTSPLPSCAEPLDAAVLEVDATGLRSSEPCAATGS